MKLNKTKKIALLAASAALVFATASCSKKTASVKAYNTSYNDSSFEMEEVMALGSMYADQAAAPAVSRKSAANGSNLTIQSSESLPQSEKKLIKNGSIELEVQDLAQAEASIQKQVEELGGYIESSYMDTRSINWSVRIPSDKFDQAMELCSSSGSVKYRNVYTSDVSERYYDLESRLATRRIMKENLEQYLKDAKNLDEILRVEQELNSVIMDIESMEGSFRRLSAQVDYSTISVTVRLPYGQEDPVVQKPGMGEVFGWFGSAVGKFYGGLVMAVLMAIICGAGLIAVLAFFFWLLFGKVGIIRKLYNKLKK